MYIDTFFIDSVSLNGEVKSTRFLTKVGKHYSDVQDMIIALAKSVFEKHVANDLDNRLFACHILSGPCGVVAIDRRDGDNAPDVANAINAANNRTLVRLSADSMGTFISLRMAAPPKFDVWCDTSQPRD